MSRAQINQEDEKNEINFGMVLGVKKKEVKKETPKPDKKGAEKVIEKQVAKPTKPVNEKPAKPDKKGPEKVIEKQFEKPVKLVNEKPAKPVDEKPAKSVDEKPAKPVDEKPAKPVDEKPAKPFNEKPAKPGKKGAEKVEKPAKPGKKVDEKPAKPGKKGAGKVIEKQVIEKQVIEKQEKPAEGKVAEKPVEIQVDDKEPDFEENAEEILEKMDQVTETDDDLQVEENDGTDLNSDQIPGKGQKPPEPVFIQKGKKKYLYVSKPGKKDPEGQVKVKAGPRPIHLFGKPKKNPPPRPPPPPQNEADQKNPQGTGAKGQQGQGQSQAQTQPKLTPSQELRMRKRDYEIRGRQDEKYRYEDFDDFPDQPFFNYIGLFVAVVMVMIIIGVTLLIYSFHHDEVWNDYIRRTSPTSDKFRAQFEGTRLYRNNGKEIMSISCAIIGLILLVIHIFLIFADSYYSVVSMSRDLCLMIFEFILLVVCGSVFLVATNDNRRMYSKYSDKIKVLEKCLDSNYPNSGISDGDLKDIDRYNTCQLDGIRLAVGILFLVGSAIIFTLLLYICCVAVCMDDDEPSYAYYESAPGVYVYSTHPTYYGGYPYGYAPYGYYRPYYYDPYYPGAAGLGTGMMLGYSMGHGHCHYDYC